MSDERAGSGGGRLDFASNGQASPGKEGERWMLNVYLQRAYSSACQQVGWEKRVGANKCPRSLGSPSLSVEGRLKGGVLVLLCPTVPHPCLRPFLLKSR